MSPPGARQRVVSFGAKKCHLVPKGDIRQVSINPDCLTGDCRLYTNRRLQLQNGTVGTVLKLSKTVPNHAKPCQTVPRTGLCPANDPNGSDVGELGAQIKNRLSRGQEFCIVLRLVPCPGHGGPMIRQWLWRKTSPGAWLLIKTA